MKVRVKRIENWDFDIKKTMEKKGLTYSKIGKMTGLHRTYIFQIASGLACNEQIAKLIIKKMTNNIKWKKK